MRWIGELGDEDLDPKLLLWDMHRNVDHERRSRRAGRWSQFSFPDVPPRSRDWWLVIDPDDVDVCDVDPGTPVAVTITASLRTMVRDLAR